MPAIYTSAIFPHAHYSSKPYTTLSYDDDDDWTEIYISIFTFCDSPPPQHYVFDMTSSMYTDGHSRNTPLSLVRTAEWAPTRTTHNNSALYSSLYNPQNHIATAADRHSSIQPTLAVRK